MISRCENSVEVLGIAWEVFEWWSGFVSLCGAKSGTPDSGSICIFKGALCDDKNRYKLKTQLSIESDNGRTHLVAQLSLKMSESVSEIDSVPVTVIATGMTKGMSRQGWMVPILNLFSRFVCFTPSMEIVTLSGRSGNSQKRRSADEYPIKWHEMACLVGMLRGMFVRISSEGVTEISGEMTLPVRVIVANGFTSSSVRNIKS